MAQASHSGPGRQGRSVRPAVSRDLGGGGARLQGDEESALLRDEFKAAGFRVDEGVAGMPTAFVATWGSGKPVIGIMGEFDALPGLSQESVPEQKARVAGAPGHGCGHNLLGVASLAAALAVKAQLESRKLPGTIRYYGTPAEEGGNGKVYMVRAGLFRTPMSCCTGIPATATSPAAPARSP